jgi:hypothetical protein
MTEGKALGRSPLKEREDFLAEALLSKPVTPNSESLIVNKDSLLDNRESVIANSESYKEIDPEILTRSMRTSFYNPRVSLYSPMVASMLEYLKLTVPGFCKSDEGTRILERAFKKEYPEIWKTLEEKATTEQEWIDLGKKRRKATILRR